MPPREIAPGVYWLPLGKGLRAVNTYLVRTPRSWSLVDAGWAGDAPAIRTAAEELFGTGTPPTSIILTHHHPDHGGAARELCRSWAVPVWVHPRELPLALGDVSALRCGTGPLDRWAILPALRAMGKERMGAVLARGSLAGAVRALAADAAPPGLPGWQVLATPGHTPGHIALVRPDDRVVITGDALVTVELNALPGVLLGTRRVSTPPWLTTWDWTTAKASATAVAALAPRVIAGGHGAPLCGHDAREGARRFLHRS